MENLVSEQKLFCSYRIGKSGGEGSYEITHCHFECRAEMHNRIKQDQSNH